MQAFGIDTAATLELIRLGGPVVAVLAIMSVLGLAIVLLKAWQFFSARVWSRAFIEPSLDDWRAGRTQIALTQLEAHASPIATSLATTLRGLEAGIAQATVREEAARVGARELANLRAYFRPLEVIGTLAPLLGLLGTVLGMIEAFQELEQAGSQVNPSILSGGIWEALLTTALGLIVAIPAVAALNWLERIVERLHQDMQDALTRVFTHDAGATAAVAGSETQTSAPAAHAY